MTDKYRDALLTVIERYIRVKSSVSSDGGRLRADVVLSHAMTDLENAAIQEEREAIVAWLRSENGRCDCFAYDDNECACGGRDEYKTWPLEQTAERIEAGEHLK